MFLRNRHTGEEEAASIASPIAQGDIDCYAAEWKPVLDSKVEELKRLGQYTKDGVALHNVEDAHWEWPRKVLERAKELRWNSFAVRCAEKTQGMMFVDMVHRCRLAAQSGAHMVYIDLVSTAPWNRPRLSPRPVYRGVGEVLMTEAILLSRDEGFDGRIGLHALPGASDFYRVQWGMEALGADASYDELHYFELTSERAVAFLSK